MSFSNKDIVDSEKGLGLTGTILSLDASKSSHGVSFYSSILSWTGGVQGIASEETCRFLTHSRFKPSLIVAPYERPFSLGRLRLEVLPAGGFLGSSSLWIEKDQERIFYAPALQPRKMMGVRSLVLKEADTLILGAQVPLELIVKKEKDREKETQRLKDDLLKSISMGQWPTLVCTHPVLWQEALALASNLGLQFSLPHKLFAWAKVYAYYSPEVFKIGKRTGGKQRPMLSLQLAPYWKPDTSSKGVFVWQTSQFPQGAVPQTVPVYTSSLEPGLGDLKAIVETIRPKNIFIYGPYSRSYKVSFEEFFEGGLKQLPHNGQKWLF